jgi:hypothetical protein
MVKNERVFSGHVVSWVLKLISEKKTIFEEVTNDESLKVDSGKTLYPDILLFTDKISGTIFNGWELKLPDTEVDDETMLLNALEKAKKIGSKSFVTWNCSKAIIWGIDKDYNLEGLKKIKEYPKIPSISRREDISNSLKYVENQKFLQKQLINIIQDLDSLYQKGELSEAINVSENFSNAINETKIQIIPHLKKEIISEKGANQEFRKKFNEWEIIESQTLNLLKGFSSEEILAKFIYYRLVGKLILYLNLSHNLGILDKISIPSSGKKISKNKLNNYFNKAKEIDYNAVFNKDFTDEVKFNEEVEKKIFNLLEKFEKFSFNILPVSVIGNILENLISSEEKQKFGQYFTSENLADLISFPSIKDKKSIIFDPTCGTGTFLVSFYEILKYFGEKNEDKLLNQIWGNEISQFPSTLSVINLYKQNPEKENNFPRVINEDFFELNLEQDIKLPDPKKQGSFQDVNLPMFDSIISNFPFIEQEKLDKEKLDKKLKEFYGNNFSINERSDLYIYCFYNSLPFLKDNGFLSAITSNSWLGKEYGLKFKKFLLDNFHIKYVIKSSAEHWFKDSKVSTIYLILEKKKSDDPTKFITFNKKIDSFIGTKEDKNKYYKEIEKLYSQIDFCEDKRNKNWRRDNHFKNTYKKNDGSVNVSIVSKTALNKSLKNKENWNSFFISENVFDSFGEKIISPYKKGLINVFRGVRTGYDKLHILRKEEAKKKKFNQSNIYPLFKSSKDFKRIMVKKSSEEYCVFSPQEEIESLNDEEKKWIKKQGSEKTIIGGVEKTIKNKFIENENRNPKKWFSIPEKNFKIAKIFAPINYGERMFFGYSEKGGCSNQRLIGINSKNEKDDEFLVALLNSITSLLSVELHGIPRYEGSLDLNSDFLKSEKIKMLDPSLISKNEKKEIIKLFKKLAKRDLCENVRDEFLQKDRIKFDKKIFEAYKLEGKIMKKMYDLIINLVENRINLKNK